MLFLPRASAGSTGTHMKTIALVLCTGLLGAALAPASRQEPQPGKKKAENPVTRFFQEEGERLMEEVEGSWMLFGYTDPNIPPLEDAASGFATFHDGFLTWLLAIDSAERRLFRLREFLILESGAYRYRFDEQANLQLSSVMSFTNNTEDGELEREPSGLAFEYFVQLQEGVLELRNPAGVVLSLRKVEAGDFPDSAIQKIEGRRGNEEKWEDEDPDPPR